MSRCTGRLTRMPVHPHLAGHHVFADAPANIALHGHPGLLVHPSNEVAGMAPNFDLDGTIQSRRNTVATIGILDVDPRNVGPGQLSMQELVQFPHGHRGQVESASVAHEATAVACGASASLTDHE